MDDIRKKKPAGLTWQAHEHEHEERSNDWYWAVGIIAVTLALISILLENLLFAVFIIIGAAALVGHRIKRPRLINFEINKKGIITEKTLYPYRVLESFFISDDEKKGYRLVVRSKKFFMPYLVIPIDQVDPDDVGAYLIEFLDEEEDHEESLAVMFMEKLGF